MIPIAKPLASPAAEERIVRLVEERMGSKMVATGIKGCQKRILSGTSGLLILTADTTPMDIISHLPVLCEDRGIKYVFVRGKHAMPNKFTCVFIDGDENDRAIQEIIECL